MNLPAPTILELSEVWQEELDGWEQVSETTSPDDHGYAYEYVFHREADDTYWETSGVCQGGGDYHQLREAEGYVCRVYPHAVTTIEYTSRK